MNMLLWLLYSLSPIVVNWVYLNVAQPVNDTGERLLMLTDTIGLDPTLPIIGAMFFVRDLIQQRAGRLPAVVAIVAGTICSAVVSPEVALASGSAFLLSEAADMATFTALHRFPVWAVLASGLVGSFIDTFTFLLVAFGSTDTWEPQVIGKIVATLICTAGYALWRKR